MKKVLIVHNLYRNFGGEDSAVNGDEKSYDKNTGLILKISDLSKAKEGIKEIHKSSGVDSPVEYQTLKINDLGLTLL